MEKRFPRTAVIWIFLLFCGVAELADTHSLWLNFTVRAQHEIGQPWCEVKFSAGGNPILHYDNINGTTALGPLGKEVNGTEHLVDRLKYMGEELKKRLLDIKGQCILQVRVFYQLEGERQEVFMKFTINRQHHFNFYPMNMTWSETNPEAKEIINKWKNDKELLTDIKFMNLDSFDWLETFSKHLKTPDSQTTSTTLIIIGSVVGGILIIVLCFIVWLMIRYKRDQQNQPNEEGQRSCFRNCLRDERGQWRVLPCIAGLPREAENTRETTELQREEQGGRLLQDTEGSNLRSFGDEEISTSVEDARSPADGEISISLEDAGSPTDGEISISVDSAKFPAHDNGGCV